MIVKMESRIKEIERKAEEYNEKAKMAGSPEIAISNGRLVQIRAGKNGVAAVPDFITDILCFNNSVIDYSCKEIRIHDKVEVIDHDAFDNIEVKRISIRGKAMYAEFADMMNELSYVKELKAVEVGTDIGIGILMRFGTLLVIEGIDIKICGGEDNRLEADDIEVMRGFISYLFSNNEMHFIYDRNDDSVTDSFKNRLMTLSDLEDAISSNVRNPADFKLLLEVLRSDDFGIRRVIKDYCRKQSDAWEGNRFISEIEIDANKYIDSLIEAIADKGVAWLKDKKLEDVMKEYGREDSDNIDADKGTCEVKNDTADESAVKVKTDTEDKAANKAQKNDTDKCIEWLKSETLENVLKEYGIAGRKRVIQP